MSGFDVAYGLEVVEVGLIASIKFIIAPFEAERYNFSFWESFAVTTTGGLVGLFAFYYAGLRITFWWRNCVALLKSIFIRKPLAVIKSKPRKKFTRGRRFVIGIKMRFGIVGIALITPSLISIPIGTIVAANFYKKKRGVMLYFIASLILWSFMLNGIAHYIGLSRYLVIPD